MLRAFARQTASLAKQCGYATTEQAKQSAKLPCFHLDYTYNELNESRDSQLAGSMRTSNYFDQLPFVTSVGPLKLELRNAVIVAMRICAGAKLNDPKYVYPEVASIVIANEHRRALKVYNYSARGDKFICSGRKVFLFESV